jgi:hypothetical protein
MLTRNRDDPVANRPGLTHIVWTAPTVTRQDAAKRDACTGQDNLVNETRST